MLKLDEIQMRLLREVADLHKVPEGAYNIRSNSQSAGRKSTENIEIVSKKDVSGLEIHIKPGTKHESVHIPVVMTESGLKETVYNDFYIGEDSDVVIIAGCGIDNCGNQDSQHDGIHRFFVGKGARVRYVEKHYGSGEGKGKRILNPVTEVYQEENSSVEMEMVQIKGVDDTNRTTLAELGRGAKLIIRERLMTHGKQNAVSAYDVHLNGDTKNFGGLEWIVDGEYGRKNYPGTWAECTVRECYASGISFNRIVREHRKKMAQLDPIKRRRFL